MNDESSSQVNIDFGVNSNLQNAVIHLDTIVGRDLILNHDPHTVAQLNSSDLNPYIGLQSFTYPDHPKYAGREQTVSAAIERLIEPGAEQSFLLVTGASGSGKSSFVQAGMLPRLSQHYRQKNLVLAWQIFRPRKHPMAALSGALLSIGAAIPSGQVITLSEWHSIVHKSLPPRYVPCLVIDQFEEVFGSQAATDERATLFELLTTLPPYATRPMHIIATLRSDFLPDLFDYPELYEATNRSINLRVMTKNELQKAIVQPAAHMMKVIEHLRPELARRIGPKYWERELVEKLANDAEKNAALLPLLQVTLQDIWSKGKLGLSAYTTLTAAIQERADNVWRFSDYDELKQISRSETQQAAILVILLDLVDVSLDDDVRRDVRRSIALTDLTAHSPERRLIIEDLINARLLSKSLLEEGAKPGTERIDIIHESLLINWERLAKAIQDQRTLLQERARFRDDLAQWRTSGVLLEGVRLATAIDLAQNGDTTTQNADARACIAQSVATRDAKQTERLREAEAAVEAARQNAEAQRQRAEAQEQQSKAERQRAETQTRLTRRTVRLAIVLAVLMVFAFGAAAFALNKQKVAQEQEYLAQEQRILADEQRILAERRGRISHAQALAAQANDQLDNDPELSILLATEAISATLKFGETAQPEAIEALHRALTASQVRMTLVHPKKNVVGGVYSPDGNHIATVGAEGIGRIWDAKTGENIFNLEGHLFSLYDVVYSKDGSKIIAAGDGKAVIVWDATTGQGSLAPQENLSGIGLRALGLSPDGQRIVTAGTSSYGDVEIIDANSLATVLTLSGHKGYVFEAKYSPDGQKIITAGDDRTAKIWDASSGKEILSMVGHTDRVIGASFSPDGLSVVTASWDGTVKLWNAQTGQEIYTFQGHTDKVRSARFSPDGKYIVSAGWDMVARVWDIEHKKLRFTLPARTNKITKALYSPDGMQIVAADEAGLLTFWDAETGMEKSQIKVSAEAVQGLTFSPDGKHIITVGIDGIARQWDTQSHQFIKSLEGQKPSLNKVAYSPDGSMIATCGFDNTIRLWEASTGKLLRTLRGHQRLPIAISFHPDGKILLTGDGFTRMKRWDIKTGIEISTIDIGESTYLSSVYSPDGSKLTGGFSLNRDEPYVGAIIDANTGNILQKLIGHTDRIYVSAFSPDGSKVATGSVDKTARIWNAQTGEPLFTLAGHHDLIFSVAFSPDGLYLVTASFDGTAKVWNTENGSLIKTLVGHRYPIYGAVFSPDVTHILTTSGDGTAKVWNARASAEISTIDIGKDTDINSAFYNPLANNILVSYQDLRGNDFSQIFVSDNGSLIGTLKEINATGAIYSPDGKSIVTNDGNNSAIWDTEKLTITHKITGFSPTYCPNGMYLITSHMEGDNYLMNIWDTRAYTLSAIIDQNILQSGGISPQCAPDSQHVAASYGSLLSKSHKIVIWNLATLQIEETITQTDFMLNLQYSPDGKELAIGSFDSTITIWTIGAKKSRLHLIGHTQPIFHLTYSPDGSMLASSSTDGTSKVWDTQTGALLFTLSDHQGMVVSSAFSTDGRKLVTASRDGTVRQYFVKIDDLLRLASTRVTRHLSPEEKKQFIENK